MVNMNFNCTNLVEIKSDCLPISEVESDIGYTNRYLTKGGKPWVPVMGEFHFSRYSAELWEDEILKMKAGGITVISIYVFWLHHEEKEGQFNFSGDCDLHRFLSLCQKHGMLAFLRIGPWCHGEARWGGFPQFIQMRFDKRSNAKGYMKKVRAIYEQYYNQSKDFFYPGGCVLGIQLENEYGGRDKDHIAKLRELAVDVGFKLPIYTKTAWPIIKGAETNILPMFGGYPERPWVQSAKPLKNDERYLIEENKTDSGIGTDILKPSKNGEVTYYDFPYAACEQGSGVQVTEHRRPIISSSDIYSMLLIALAKGMNFPGYYMYHGGRNPYGGLYQESRRTAYPSNCPVSSYDFQAPISEYGYLRESYHRFKLVHYFLNTFGEEFAITQTVLSDDNTREIDFKAAVRINRQGSGFAFINNYRRYDPYEDIVDLKMNITAPSGENITLPPISIKSGVSMFYPFNMDVEGTKFDYITAQPICRVSNAERTEIYFFSPKSTHCTFKTDNDIATQAKNIGSVYRLDDYDETKPAISFGSCDIFVLSEESAMKMWLCDGKVFFSDGAVLPDCNATYVIDENSAYRPEINLEKISVKKMKYDHYLFSKGEKGQYLLTVPKDLFEHCDDCKIVFDFVGSVAQAYCGGRLMADVFNYDGTMTIGLKRFKAEIEKGLSIIIKASPIDKKRRIYLECDIPRGQLSFKIRNIVTYSKTRIK